MNTLIQPAHLSLQEAFATTLIHSLWQGAVIVFLLWILKVLFNKKAALNYILSLTALIAMGTSSLITFILIWTQGDIRSYPNTLFAQILDKPEVLKWVTIVWLVGSTIFFLRFLLSHFYLRRLISRSKPILNNHWIKIFEQLKTYYSIHKSIVLLHSDRVGSAFLTGVIKPVIIIPTSWVNHLTIKEAECILAHELSHVFNRDHWVNLFIHFSEIFFYFNPAVHILISHIKLERELKADSSACNYIKEPILYAKLILKIEETFSFTPALTLPFFQQRKQLKRRIESVLKIKSSKNEFTSGIALFALVVSVLFFETVSIKNHSLIPFPLANTTEICATNLMKTDLPVKPQALSICLTNSKSPRPLSKPSPGRDIQPVGKTGVNTTDSNVNSEESDEETIAFADEFHDSDILQQIEKEIKAERNSRRTIIYEISKNAELDSNESNNGGNWITPRQIKYYAPSETKTYIIIKSRNAPSIETESDWNTPGHIRIQSIDKH
jgi:beta-lactamase regulating signal transducer with metallopeptidase domain